MTAFIYSNPLVVCDMTKKIVLLNIILFGIFVLSTIITLFIVYKDIDTPYSFIFVIGYVIFLLAFALYIVIVACINLRKSNWEEIRIRTLSFIGLFILLSTANYLFNYFLKPEKNHTYGFLLTALAFSFGLSFFDMAWRKKKL